MSASLASNAKPRSPISAFSIAASMMVVLLRGLQKCIGVEYPRPIASLWFRSGLPVRPRLRYFSNAQGKEFARPVSRRIFGLCHAVHSVPGSPSLPLPKARSLRILVHQISFLTPGDICRLLVSSSKGRQHSNVSLFFYNFPTVCRNF